MKKELIVEDVFGDLEIKKQVKIRDNLVNVPVKYKTQSVMGFFPISTKKAISFINNKRMKPVEISFGKSLVGITLFNHVGCPVGPYREIAFSIPVVIDSSTTIPFLTLVLNTRLRNFGFYSFLLTASTEIGKEHAEEIWGYPFYSKNIEVSLEEDKSCYKVLAKEKQEKIFLLTVMKAKKEKIIKKDYQTYFLKEGKLIRVELNTIGITGSSLRKDSGHLELGSHEISNILKDIEIILEPIETIYYRDGIKIANIPEII